MSTDCVTDAELVDRARQGDAAAFGELVNRHRMAVYHAALAAIGSPADAEDAAQDAFLLAYRRLASFRGDASFKTWLLTIAWHQAINRRRRVMRMLRWMVEPAHESEIASGEPVMALVATNGPSPEESIAANQLRVAVRHELARLKPKLRDPLLLAQSGEYTYEEIGEILGAPVGTIKWRVSEARRVIKERLRSRGFEYAARR